MTDLDDLPPPRQTTFKRNAHIAYFLRCLQGLPSKAVEYDSNRVTLTYFCISGLDLLGALAEKTTTAQRSGWAEWIWSLQHPQGGFRGSTFMTTINAETSPPHLPSTYTALLALSLLRAPLDKLNIPGLLAFLRSCQAEDGSFSPLPGSHGGVEAFQNDLRMTYCACAVSSFLDDFTKVDVLRARRYIERCRTWEGAYAARPGLEAQGGTTYCAVASLHLLPPHSEQASTHFPADHDLTLRWLAQRQIGGFQGRPGKLEDVCYSFWIGGAMTISRESDLADHAANTSFLLSAQSPIGGFGKEPDDFPDPFHSYLALAALAMSPERERLGLGRLSAAWNVSVETRGWMKAEIRRFGQGLHE